MREMAKKLALLVLWLVVAGSLQAAGLSSQPSTSPVSSDAHQRQFLNQYCVACHNERLRTAGLALDTADVANVGEAAPVWEKVVRKLRAGAMPPVGRPRPDSATYEGFTARLEAQLDDVASAAPHPGRPEALHRLNRTEYKNAVRDLLAIDVDVASLLPPDDGSYGFDNIAAVLRISPTLLERYLSAARKTVRLALGSVGVTPKAETFRLPSDLRQDDRLGGMPFGTRGGTSIQYNFPLDGAYEFQVRLARSAVGDLVSFPDRHELEISIDGERVRTFAVGGEPLGRVERDTVDANWRFRVPVKAGPREVLVTFVKNTSALDETNRLPFLRPYAGHLRDTRYQPHIDHVVIAGPFEGRTPKDTPSRRRIFVCYPETRADEAPCAGDIMSMLARNAYRRPVTEADLRPLLKFYEEGAAVRGFEGGIESALRALLSSSSFLFRVERDPAGVPPNTSYRVTDLELASRLSFFLWSSSPDDELLGVAERGGLKDPAELRIQVNRMLADRRSRALVSNFAGQWLYLRNLPETRPEVTRFPDYDESLRQAFRRETELFFDSILRENRSAIELLTARYTFVNDRLAKHYGIPNVYVSGPEFKRVELPFDSPRGGLLGQGGILTTTAYATRTSPVIRGKWILENLLGYEPPPPPPGVEALEETDNGAGQLLSMRDRMVQHRASPACASCHAIMDPLGLSLENFDAVGRWRSLGEDNRPIDTAGTLPDGTSFDGPGGLRRALLRRPDSFVATVTEKLLTYALGRGLEYYDMPAVRKIVRENASNSYRLKDLIVGIIDSVPFQMRQSAPERQPSRSADPVVSPVG